MHGDRKVIFYMNIYSTNFWGFFKTFNNNGFMILFFFLEDNNPKRFPKTQKENRENLFLHFLPNK